MVAKKSLFVLLTILIILLTISVLPLRAQTVEIDTCVLDIVFMMDESGSMSSAEFQQQKAFISDVIGTLPIQAGQTQAGAGAFSSVARLIQPLTFNSIQLQNSINGAFQLGGATNLTNAINTAQGELNTRGRFSVQKVIAVLTDGNPTSGDSIPQVQQAANNARSQGTILFALGVGNSVNFSTLQAIANEPDNQFIFQADSFDQLPNFLDSVSDAACGSPAEIGGTVFIDVNQNGAQDVGENAAPGVIINLYAEGAVGGTPLQTTATNAAGSYVFQVEAGGYVLEVVPPAAHLISTPIDFSQPGNQTVPIAVVTNDTVANVDTSLKPALACEFDGGTVDTGSVFPTATFTLRNVDNTLVPFDGAQVDVAVNPATAILSGTTSALTAGGTATFADLSVNVVGNYSLLGTVAALGINADCGAINVDNRPPIAQDDNYVTEEDTALVVPAPGILGNDSDPEGDPIALVPGLVSSPALGSVTVNADGGFTYTPAFNASGIDSFVYSISDGSLNDSATVTVTINPSNDPPVLVVNQANITVDEGEVATNGGTVNDIDSPAPTLTASIGTITDHGDGTWSWEFVTSDGPAETQSVSITATDNTGSASSESFDLTVNNIAPVVNAGPDLSFRPNETVSVHANFSDPGSGDTHTATVDWGDGSAENGVVDQSARSIMASHNYPNRPANYTVTVCVTDDDGATGCDTLIITRQTGQTQRCEPPGQGEEPPRGVPDCVPPGFRPPGANPPGQDHNPPDNPPPAPPEQDGEQPGNRPDTPPGHSGEQPGNRPETPPGHNGEHSNTRPNDPPGQSNNPPGRGQNANKNGK